MNKLLTMLAAVLLAAGPALFNGCQTTDSGTEIPNELRGRELLAGTGQPAAGAEVRLVPVGYVPGADSSKVLFTAVADSKGEFTFLDLPVGQYNVLASKGNLISFRDSVAVTGKRQTLAADTLKSPGSLAGTVKLQPQHDPRTATVQVLGTTVYVNVGEDGGFILPDLGGGEYRLRVVTILPNYVPLYRAVTVRSGQADVLEVPLEPFYAGIPVIKGLRSSPGPEGTTVLRWNKPAYSKVQAYLVYRDPLDATLPSTSPHARVLDTTYIDTVYSKAPRANQFPYLDSADHPFRYRVRILDQTDTVGPSFGSVEASAVPPSRKLASGLWKQATASAAFPKRARGKAMAFRDKLWVYGGSGEDGVYLHDLWSTTDGKEWQKAPAPPSVDSNFLDAHPIVFQDKMWLMIVKWTLAGAPVHALWNSLDGLTWKLVSDSVAIPGRTGFTLAAYKDKLWVIEGFDRSGIYWKDIRTSSDGITWTEFDPGPSYQPTAFATADTLGGNLWKIGAGSGAHNYNSQIWKFDNTSATKVADTAEFLPRNSHTLISFHNKLWLIAGFQINLTDWSKSVPMNDVWVTQDGVNWSIADAHAPFAARFGQSCAVFQNRLWIIGGADSGVNTAMNDVWYLEEN